MKVPAEITYRNVDKTEAIDNLIHEKIAKLEKFCDHISSCRVAIEKAHEHPNSGSPYRVRFDIRVPPNHELAVVRNPGEGNQYDDLSTVIRSAFEAARKQLIELNERQRNEVKYHPEQENIAIVTKLFPEAGYGFIRSSETGREIYFHRNSVLNDKFDELKEGAGVQFTEEEGMSGPQATKVHLVNKPGSAVPKEQKSDIKTPAGW
jgi:ribosomal subunit interface protein